MYIAVFIGIVIGWWLASRHIDHWLLVFYHYRYRTAKKYLDLYDLCDSEFSFQMMQGQNNPPKTYAQFLLWHQNCRPKAGKAFRKYWSAVTKELMRDSLLFVVLPTIIFWRNWAFFLLAVVLVHTGYLVHRRLIKKNNLDFYALLMHTTVIKELNPSSKR